MLKGPQETRTQLVEDGRGADSYGNNGRRFCAESDADVRRVRGCGSGGEVRLSSIAPTNFESFTRSRVRRQCGQLCERETLAPSWTTCEEGELRAVIDWSRNGPPVSARRRGRRPRFSRKVVGGDRETRAGDATGRHVYRRRRHRKTSSIRNRLVTEDQSLPPTNTAYTVR